MQEHEPLKIADVLGVGRKNALRAEELQGLLGIPDRRTLSKKISEERQKGALILPDYDNGGFYIPDPKDPGDVKEIEHFIYRMEKMARETEQATESAKEFLRAMTA